jgi:hypothetical protein
MRAADFFARAGRPSSIFPSADPFIQREADQADGASCERQFLLRPLNIERSPLDRWGETMSEPDAEHLLAQFNRLIQDLLRGTLKRNTFRPWEIELLLDIQDCNLREKNRREILRRYQRAVQREADRGSPAGSLLKLSEYLDRQKARKPVVSIMGGGGAVQES